VDVDVGAGSFERNGVSSGDGHRGRQLRVVGRVEVRDRLPVGERDVHGVDVTAGGLGGDTGDGEADCAAVDGEGAAHLEALVDEALGHDGRAGSEWAVGQLGRGDEPAVGQAHQGQIEVGIILVGG